MPFIISVRMACRSSAAFFASMASRFSLSRPALRHIDAQEEARIAAEEYEMFDEGNEIVSIDQGRVEALDHAFADAFQLERVKSLAADYIRAHALAFLQEKQA